MSSIFSIQEDDVPNKNQMRASLITTPLAEKPSLHENTESKGSIVKRFSQALKDLFGRPSGPTPFSKDPKSDNEPLLENYQTASVLGTAHTQNNPRFATLEHLSPWFPEADPSDSKAKTFTAWRSKRGRVLWFCALVAGIVFLINVVVTILFRIEWKATGGFGVIYQGECSNSKRINSGLHIVINILSTALLAASNLCMQLLAAPTRKEIDEAHSKFRWLDIGVPSFRNLSSISSKRRTIVFILVISSVPLHFL